MENLIQLSKELEKLMAVMNVIIKRYSHPGAYMALIALPSHNCTVLGYIKWYYCIRVTTLKYHIDTIYGLVNSYSKLNADILNTLMYTALLTGRLN